MVGRRTWLSLSCFAVAFAAATAAWPAVHTHLGAAAAAVGRGDARLLLLSGLIFAAAPACCGLVWHHALVRAGARLGRAEACARYGVGSLVNSVAPLHLGEVARTALFLEALTGSGRRPIVRCYATVQGIRIAALAALALAASLPLELAPVVLLLSFAGALAALRRDARRLLALSLLAPAVRVVAVAVALAALGAPAALQAAFAVVPALELASLLPLTPGNVGLAGGAAGMALHASGLPMQQALSAGIVVHAVGTAAGDLLRNGLDLALPRAAALLPGLAVGRPPAHASGRGVASRSAHVAAPSLVGVRMGPRRKQGE